MFVIFILFVSSIDSIFKNLFLFLDEALSTNVIS